MTRCLAPDCLMGGLGCDNMTVLIVCFLNGEPYEKLAEKCRLHPMPLNSSVTNGQKADSPTPTNNSNSNNNNNKETVNNNTGKMLNNATSNLTNNLSSNVNSTNTSTNALSSGI